MKSSAPLRIASTASDSSDPIRNHRQSGRASCQDRPRRQTGGVAQSCRTDDRIEFARSMARRSANVSTAAQQASRSLLRHIGNWIEIDSASSHRDDHPSIRVEQPQQLPQGWLIRFNDQQPRAINMGMCGENGPVSKQEMIDCNFAGPTMTSNLESSWQTGEAADRTNGVEARRINDSSCPVHCKLVGMWIGQKNRPATSPSRRPQTAIHDHFGRRLDQAFLGAAG